MTQTYPFERGAPGGVDYVYGQRVNPVELNTIDKNAAQAADGLIWSDLAVVKNFRKSTTVAYTEATNKVIWDAYLDRWIYCASGGGAPFALYSYDGQDDWINLSGVPVGTNWGVTSAGASNGAGVVLLGGSPPGAASATKIRQSTNGGSTWNSRSTVANSTEGVTAMCWHSGASLFVLGLDSAATTNIETSPTGQTWTQRTGLPNSVARSAAASSGGIAVVTNATGNKCLRSVDAVTWTEGTMPIATNWQCVTWSNQLELFFAAGLGALASSADGTTWSSSGLQPPFITTYGIAAYGRLLVATGVDSSQYAISASVDGGVTWIRVKSMAAASSCLAAGDNQVVCLTDGYFYSSLRAGL
jgi:hypothetical protein